MENLKTLKDRIGNLITIKSLVTLIITIVFAFLSLRGDISAELFMAIFTTIIAFYFGTQANKDK